jgi:crotonobetainyl-CoA:carnitine CoA-transferase CaiB-like acyl-CoA transferase
MSSALDGIKVIDVSQVAAVPMAARHLADFGADVLHIENPVTGDSWRIYQAGQDTGRAGAPSEINYNWENFNRNKRSVTINISLKGGQAVIYKFIEQADVFLTNLRPFELKRYNLEYKTLNKLNPRLVYAALTGFGKKGPEKDTPAYDATAYWSRSGIPYMFTRPGMTQPGFRPAFGDNMAGMALAYGIMTSLYVREKTGKGQEVDVALLHAGLYQLGFDIAGALATGLDYNDWGHEPPPEVVAAAEAGFAPAKAFYRSKAPNPLSGRYTTRDGRIITIVALQPDRYWGMFCRALGLPELENDPRFNTIQGREENNAILYPILDEAFAGKTLDEWKPILEGIPYAVHQNLHEVINDPQARANDFFVAYDHPTYGRLEAVANPVILSETPATIRMAAPEFGQHTEEVLLEYGYTWEDIALFKEQGIIA